MVEIRWTSQSIDDLNNIAEFISKDSPKYARLFIEKIFDRSEILTTHPNSGRIVPEIKDESIRELIFNSYRIIYKLYSKRIDVLTVHHGSRLLKNSPLFKK